MYNNDELMNQLKEDLMLTRKGLDLSKNVANKTVIVGVSTVIIFLIMIIITTFLMTKNLKSMQVEVESFTFEIDRGIKQIDENLEELQTQMEEGNGYRINLKEDAYAVIDDTNIVLDNGISNIEIEKILDNHKYAGETNIDGDLTDQNVNAYRFNYMWGVEQGITNEDSYMLLFDDYFKQRLTYTHQQHIYRIDWEYFNQQEIPEIGNVICVPSSATILFNSLSEENIDVRGLIDFFQNNEQIQDYARSIFGQWIEKYIRENKLYQITGLFTYGFNLFIDMNFPEFCYKLDYDYWSIDEIADYVQDYGLMSATYFPSWVRYGKRYGGHMVAITKVYYDFNNNLLAFGINDPYGNPNVSYRGERGLDGKNVIIDIKTMETVMKSYYDDHNKGSDKLYRILFFRNNINLQ